jgi:hypothetical protein
METHSETILSACATARANGTSSFLRAFSHNAWSKKASSGQFYDLLRTKHLGELYQPKTKIIVV